MKKPVPTDEESPGVRQENAAHSTRPDALDRPTTDRRHVPHRALISGHSFGCSTESSSAPPPPSASDAGNALQINMDALVITVSMSLTTVQSTYQ